MKRPPARGLKSRLPRFAMPSNERPARGAEAIEPRRSPAPRRAMSPRSIRCLGAVRNPERPRGDSLERKLPDRCARRSSGWLGSTRRRSARRSIDRLGSARRRSARRSSGRFGCARRRSARRSNFLFPAKVSERLEAFPALRSRCLLGSANLSAPTTARSRPWPNLLGSCPRFAILCPGSRKRR